MSNRAILDQEALEALDEVTGGDPEFLAELVNTFLEDAPILMADIWRFVEAGDAVEVRRLAHGLKGNGREFGATDFANLCARLEHDAADQRLDTADALLNQIEQEFARVKQALEDYMRS